MTHDGEGGWFMLAETECRRASCVDEYEEDEDDDELAVVENETMTA